MSTLAKIFVIINLIMAAIFFSVTMTLYAKRVDYKNYLEVEKRIHKKDNERNKEKIEKLTGDLAKAVREKDEAVSQKNKADELANERQATIVKKDQEIATKDKRVESLESKNTSLNSDLTKSRNKITELEANLDKAKTERRLAINQRDEAFKKMRISQDEKAQMSERVKELEDAKKKSEDKVASLEFIIEELERIGIEVDALVGKSAIPIIEAKVLAVEQEVGVVMLSVGTNDKVKRGYSFTVYRGDKFIGKVIVDRLYQNMSAARIDTMNKAGIAIKEGDRAKTKLY